MILLSLVKTMEYYEVCQLGHHQGSTFSLNRPKWAGLITALDQTYGPCIAGYITYLVGKTAQLLKRN